MRIIKRIIAIAFTATALFGGVKIYQFYTAPTSNNELVPHVATTENTEKVTEDVAMKLLDETTAPESKEEKVITDSYYRISDYLNINKYTVGVISIQDLVDEPIVNTPYDQNAYLNCNIYGEWEKSNNGTLFTAQDSEIGVTNVTTIFGHRKSSGAMFGQLPKFEDISYLREHQTFEVTTQEIGTKTCKIVGVMYASADYARNDWYYAQPTLTEEEFNDYRMQVRSRSLYVIEDKFDYESKYVMLSTCSYNTDNERLVIVARILDSNETVTGSIESNPIVLRTNEFYDATGCSKPSNEALMDNYVANYGD